MGLPLGPPVTRDPGRPSLASSCRLLLAPPRPGPPTAPGCPASSPEASEPSAAGRSPDAWSRTFHKPRDVSRRARARAAGIFSGPATARPPLFSRDPTLFTAQKYLPLPFPPLGFHFHRHSSRYLSPSAIRHLSGRFQLPIARIESVLGRRSRRVVCFRPEASQSRGSWFPRAESLGGRRRRPWSRRRRPRAL